MIRVVRRPVTMIDELAIEAFALERQLYAEPRAHVAEELGRKIAAIDRLINLMSSEFCPMGRNAWLQAATDGRNVRVTERWGAP